MDDRRTSGDLTARLAPIGTSLEFSNDPPADFRPLRLRIMPGGFALDLTRPNVLLGRHSDADVRLPLADVSRRHCRFVFAAGTWQVVDLGSLNGVTVNGERVAQMSLHDGDLLRIGGIDIRAELPDDLAPASIDDAAVQAGVLRSIAHALPVGDAYRKAS